MTGVQTCALRSEEHTSELQSHDNLVCRLLLEKTTTHRRAPPPPHHTPAAPPRWAFPPVDPGACGACGHAPASARSRSAPTTAIFFLSAAAPPNSTMLPPAAPSGS